MRMIDSPSDFYVARYVACYVDGAKGGPLGKTS